MPSIKKLFSKIRPFEKAGHNTTFLSKKLKAVEDNKTFKEIYEENSDLIVERNETWCIEYINKLLAEYQVSDSTIAENCLLDRKVVRKWKSEPPKIREHFVALCCYFGLGVDTCSRMMKRFGDFASLDKNNLDDVVYIQLLNHTNRTDFYDEQKQVFYKNHKDRYFVIRDYLLSSNSEKNGKAQRDLKKLRDYSFENSLYQAQKIYAPKLLLFKEKIHDFFDDTGYGSPSKFFTEAPAGNLGATYARVVLRTIDSETMIPKRNHLISLFLHMGLPLDNTDEFLVAAGLEPLCSKNPFEAALIYTLSTIYKEYPDLKKEEIMLSEHNKESQLSLPQGSVYMEVYHRLSQDFFSEFFAEEKVDLDKMMCRNLVTPR